MRIKDNTISGKIAKDVLDAMWNGEGSADEVIESKGLKQITDTGAIEAYVDEVIANNPSQFEELKGGKDKMMGFFVGQVMKMSKGKANPAQVNELIPQQDESLKSLLPRITQRTQKNRKDSFSFFMFLNIRVFCVIRGKIF